MNFAFRTIFRLALLMGAGPALAANYVVTTLGGEEGSCSGTTCTTIRAAMAAAYATPLESDSIRFANGLRGTVVLGDTLKVNHTMTLDGDTDADGKADITLSGGDERRIIYLSAAPDNLTLNRINLTNGSALNDPGYYRYGGAIDMAFGNLVMNRVRITSSKAWRGSAIYNRSGTVTVYDSTFDGNTSGPAFAQERYLSAGPPRATFRQSTFTNNWGVIADYNDGELTLEHVTISGNPFGVGINSHGPGTTIRSSILANHDGTICNASGATIVNTLVEDGSCGVTAGVNGNRTGNPLLGEFGDFGGATPVIMPLADSPVLDAVACDAVPTPSGSDQRGSPRPWGARCDLGAVERRSDAIVNTQSDNAGLIGNPSPDSLCSLREALENVARSQRFHTDCSYGERGVPIRFSSNVARITLDAEALDLTAGEFGVAIDGTRPGTDDVIVDANHLSRVFKLAPGSHAVLENLQLLRGDGSAGGENGDGGALLVGANAVAELRSLVLSQNRANFGAGIYNLGTLDLSNSLLSANTAGENGGGIHNGGGASAHVTYSTFYANQANLHGGGFDNNGSALIEHSTFGNNTAATGTGGAVANRSQLTLAFGTLKSNSSNLGALANTSGGNTRLFGSSLSGTSGNQGDCYRTLGELRADNNLIQSGLVCVSHDLGGNLSADPLLNPNLGSNGSATSNYLPLPGSPLVDAAPCELAPEPVSQGIDQRGIARPQGSLCDIGAVEVRQHVLSVAVSAASGAGQVASLSSRAPFGGEIACNSGATCTAVYSAEGTASQVTLTATPSGGSAFTGWSGACSGTGDCVLSMNQAHTVGASFSAAHAIDASAYPARASVSCTPNPVLHGGFATCTFDAVQTGWEFLTWSGDCSGANPVCSLGNVTAPRTVVANFREARYLVQATVGAGEGGITPAQQQVLHGRDASFSLAPANGWQVAGVSGEGCAPQDQGGGAWLAPGIVEACAVTATFSRRSYAVNFDSQGGSAIDPAIVEFGSSFTLPVPTREGFDFDAWTTQADGSGTAYPAGAVFTVPDADTTLYAQWTQRIYTLTYTAAEGGSIEGETSQNVPHGGSGTAVTAVPDEGFGFLQWSDDRTDNPRSDANVSADVSVGAIFAGLTDLSLRVLPDPGPIDPGEPTAFDLIAHNAGPKTALNARVLWTPPDTLPAVAWRCVAAPGVCVTAQGTGAIDALLILPAQAEAVFEVDVDPLPPSPVRHTNSATVHAGAGQSDPAIQNNTAVWEIRFERVFRDGFE